MSATWQRVCVVRVLSLSKAHASSLIVSLNTSCPPCATHTLSGRAAARSSSYARLPRRLREGATPPDVKAAPNSASVATFGETSESASRRADVAYA